MPPFRRGTRHATEPPARADQRPPVMASGAPPRGVSAPARLPVARGRAIAPDGIRPTTAETARPFTSRV
ncbi:MAG: hypothetical protein Q6370_007510 [Candidatus Sigynarchaeota archaeon]